MGAKTRVVVFAIDFSQLTDFVIRTAANVFGGGATLHGVCVIEPTRSPVGGELDHSGEISKLTEAVAARVAADLPGRDVKIHALVGRPAAAIAGLAREIAADLIVVGRHGDNPAGPLWVGSTPARLLQTASCSVLVAQPGSIR